MLSMLLRIECGSRYPGFRDNVCTVWKEFQADVSSVGKILLWKHMVMVFLSPITDVNAMFVYGNGSIMVQGLLLKH